MRNALQKSTRSMKLPLDGEWKFRLIGSSDLMPADVPGCVHTDLLRAGRIRDPFYGSNELECTWIEDADFEYSREFTVSQRLLAYRVIELVADGIDTLAVISVNSVVVAETESMFIGYRFNIKPYLVAGVNNITVRFNNPMEYIRNRPGYPWFDQPNDPEGGAAGIRKMQCSFGWDWGPRFPTCGIYRTIRIEARDTPRISHVAIKQHHVKNSVILNFKPETDGPVRRGHSWRYVISLGGKIIDESTSPELTVRNPKLWWPNGWGAHPLYELTVELLIGYKVVDMRRQRTGLRTIVLDRRRDEWGECFRFVVNGKPVYAKGASWVPAHIFPSSVDRERYRDLVRSAAEANFNMLRVWGGGLYEQDDFYELCDEYGIMVWHDFMFACSLYPVDERFVKSVSEEAKYQTKRLASHACMALWCGNNELEQYHREISADPVKKAAYERIFYDILPRVVKRNAPGISYWPSSPHNPDGYENGPNSERAGDAHYWDVWHAKQPPEAARRHQYRFWSEFGMQAYCSIDTALQFAAPGELNVLGPAMENHQKHPSGNALILHYIAQRYRFPGNFAALSYISQVNQAWCIGMMIEHQRSCMPRTMGSLYWQFNDCWPVFSWSGIDFGGQWRGLHYAARRFYAPALVTYRLIGDEHAGKINRRINTVSGVQVVAVYDGLENRNARLCWELFTIDDGGCVLRGEKNVRLRRNESGMCKEINLEQQFARYPKERLAMRLSLMDGAAVLATNTVLFTAPRFMDLSRERIAPKVSIIGRNRFTLLFKSRTFQHQVAFHLPQTRYRASDNFFDLFPGVPHDVTVEVESSKPVGVAMVKKQLRLISVAQSY